MRKVVEEASIDLAFDPRAGRVPARPVDTSEIQTHGALELLEAPAHSKREVTLAVAVEPAHARSDAELLADYGKPPKQWLLSPLYALRVLIRQRELKRALVARSDEAERASAELQDALVGLAEQVLSDASQRPDYADSVGALRRAEELLRVRDRVLAVENEAEMARLASADARLAKLENDLATLQSEERTLAVELQAAQQALEREESALKKAENDLRTAQRDLAGTRE